MFNFNHLYYFYVVAGSDSLTHAAVELKVSQPALSSQIKTLEARLGRNLFVKVGRHLELTSEGKVAYSYCKRIFEAAGELSDALHLNGRGQGERLALGVSEEVERPFAADVAGWLLRDRDGAGGGSKRRSSRSASIDQSPLSVRMVSDDHFVLLEQLQQRELDILLTNQPVARGGLVTLATVHMPVKAFLPRSRSKGARVRGSSPKLIKRALADAGPSLILPSPGQKLRSETETYLEKSGHRGRLVFESNVLASLVRAVVDGLGLGFFPVPYVAKEMSIGRLMEVSGAVLWQHTLYLVGGSECLTTPKTAGLRDSFIEFCKSAGCSTS